MSQDEIIAMGNEAALEHGHTYEPEPGDGTIEFLGSFAALVIAKEREACAHVCESEWSNVAERMYGRECAGSIRARSKP